MRFLPEATVANLLEFTLRQGRKGTFTKHDCMPEAVRHLMVPKTRGKVRCYLKDLPQVLRCRGAFHSWHLYSLTEEAVVTLNIIKIS